MRDRIVKDIYNYFVYHGRKWRVDGELQTVTREDIERVLDELHEAVYDESGRQAQTGGIFVENSNGHIDVYLHLGELND